MSKRLVRKVALAALRGEPGPGGWMLKHCDEIMMTRHGKA
jgi:hypothetical protein